MSEVAIQVMHSLENMTKLQELWLGRNRIKVVNLCGLKCIKKISLQSNRLTSMTGFEVRGPITFLYMALCKTQFWLMLNSALLLLQGCVALEELYLSHNGISKMEGLSMLVNLRVLDVSNNKITSVNDIENLTMYAFSF